VFQSGGLFPHISVAGNIGITPETARERLPTKSRRGSTSCSIWCGSTARNIATGCRTSCPAASASASAWRGRWPPSRSIVLMDEPFGALDPLTRDALGDDYRALHREFGLTTVMITHDMTEALLLADRVAVMRGGRLLAEGTPRGAVANSGDAYVGELLRAPRRQAERLQCLAAAGWRRMSLFSDPRWSDALTRLPDYLGSHVRVSLTAIALGLAISFPLALMVRRQPVLRDITLGVASVVQTVPGLALLALFYPLLLALAGLSLQWFGTSFSAFGFLPSVLALALYSMLPVLRNTITGLQGIEPAILEAAEGVGMTPRQSLMMVETAACAAGDHGGHPDRCCLGDRHRDALDADWPDQPRQLHLCGGLQTQNWVFVLFGCAAAAALALAVDQLLALIENGVRLRSRTRIALGCLGLVALILATLIPSMARAKTNYVVGAKTFTEQYILSSLIAQRLQAAGLFHLHA
jgi:ABC-type proline/glycine betaine transport system permease subunit